MQKAILIDPVTRSTRQIQINLGDFRAIQTAIGGRLFEEHAVRLGERVVGRVFMAENRDALPSNESFAFETLTVARKQGHRIYGTALFVPKEGDKAPPKFRFFAHAEARARVEPVIRTMSNAELRHYVESGQAENNNATIVTAESLARHYAEKMDDQHFGREPRQFMPRAVGTFNSSHCSVYELEDAFLGFYERARKDHTFRHDSPLGQSFNAPPFFFPNGLDPNNQEFDAGLAVEEGTLKLPFPLNAFWVVYWDSWFSGGRGFEGPVLLYVEEQQVGFTTRSIFCGGPGGYDIADIHQHERLSRIPSALITALYRINNRRQIIERDVASSARDSANAGRAKSKYGLAPLPGFIRVTGEVRVDSSSVVGTGIGRSPHDRRGHWRKRRKGVELPPEKWVRVRPCAIHAEKVAAAPKPYVVV